MNEQQWLTSDDPATMMAALTLVSDRKLRLFACACCRQVWHLLTDPRSRRAVEVAERYADGFAEGSELYEAGFILRGSENTIQYAPCWLTDPAARAALGVVGNPATNPRPWSAEQKAAQAALLRDIFGNPWRPAPLRWQDSKPEVYVGTAQHGFHNSTHYYDPCAWLTTSGVRLARAAYSERVEEEECRRCHGLGCQFGPKIHVIGCTCCDRCYGTGTTQTGALDPARLVVLADALEEAGCTEEALLRHMRSPGPHVRGCWAVDLILGKE